MKKVRVIPALLKENKKIRVAAYHIINAFAVDKWINALKFLGYWYIMEINSN